MCDERVRRQLLKLKHIRVDGFKAIDQFAMTVEPNLTLLLGMNGAGKTSILQVFALARHLAEGEPQIFFNERGWDTKEFRFRSNHGRSSIVRMSFTFVGRRRSRVRWSIEWGLNSGKLRSERVQYRPANSERPIEVFRFLRGKGGRIGQEEIPALGFKGSILSIVQERGGDDTVQAVTADLLSWFTNIQSLELLSPTAMKAATRLNPQNMGPRGERLAGFLAALRPVQRTRVMRRLERFIPLSNLDTVRRRAGWIDLILNERFQDFGAVASTHMSDGFMRVLALCALPELPDVTLILLDEVEDGIEPHILGRLISLIVEETRAQIIATSHSPILANVVGANGLRLISRTQYGRTVAAEVDEMPAFNLGTEFFGPGELWTNTDLAVLEREAQEVAARGATEAED